MIDSCQYVCPECNEIGDDENLRCPHCGVYWWDSYYLYDSISWGNIRPTERNVTIRDTRRYVINRGVVQLDDVHAGSFPKKFMGGRKGRTKSPFKKKNVIQGTRHGNTKNVNH